MRFELQSSNAGGQKGGWKVIIHQFGHLEEQKICSLGHFDCLCVFGILHTLHSCGGICEGSDAWQWWGHYFISHSHNFVYLQVKSIDTQFSFMLIILPISDFWLEKLWTIHVSTKYYSTKFLFCFLGSYQCLCYSHLTYPDLNSTHSSFWHWFWDVLMAFSYPCGYPSLMKSVEPEEHLKLLDSCWDFVPFRWLLAQLSPDTFMIWKKIMSLLSSLAGFYP